MIDINKLMEQILSEFKYKPEFDRYSSGDKTPWLRQYNPYEFYTKCLKLKYLRYGNIVTSSEFIYEGEQYEIIDKLIELNKYNEYRQFNALVELYNQCWRYKCSLEENN